MSDFPDRMDPVPAPRGEPSSLQETMDAVDIASSADVDEANLTMEPMVAVEKEVSQSEYETDSDASGDEWETQSLYEDAIQVLRDDQLRDGGKLLWRWLGPCAPMIVAFA